MEQYSALAEVYDKLQDSTYYLRYASYLERIFNKHGQAPKQILELACGTGTISYLLSEKGYEMIGTDISPDMLAVAQEKCRLLSCPPLFLCQDMCELDLYGTVDAAVCCLDSINYLTTLSDISKAFSLVSLFLNPQGLFIFDIKSRALFDQMAEDVSIFDSGDIYSAWQYGKCNKSGNCCHLVDMFVRRGNNNFERFSEEHFQRAYTVEQIVTALEKNRFKIKAIYCDFGLTPTKAEAGRLFFVAQNDIQQED